jgi:hypothetical protein
MNTSDVVLSIFFIVYLLIGTKTPLIIANSVNTVIGKFVLLFMAILFIIYASPIVSILFIIVIYELIIRSKTYVQTNYQQGLKSLAQYPEDTTLIYCPDNTLKEVPRTLEQDVIDEMVPPCASNTPLMKASYKPMLEDAKNAYSIV